jgi:hypothetical protein
MDKSAHRTSDIDAGGAEAVWCFSVKVHLQRKTARLVGQSQ